MSFLLLIMITEMKRYLLVFLFNKLTYYNNHFLKYQSFNFAKIIIAQWLLSMKSTAFSRVPDF